VREPAIPTVIALSLMVVMAAPVAAEGEVGGNPPIVAVAAAAAPGGQEVTSVPAQDLVGREVHNLDDQIIGEVEAVKVDEKGNVQMVVVGVGGFLGVGERHVAVDWTDIVVSSDGRKLGLNATREQLQGLPPYIYDEPSHRGTVFGATPGE
jgi:hypothetical protein